MKRIQYSSYSRFIFLIVLMFFVTIVQSEAQRMNHRASRSSSVGRSGGGVQRSGEANRSINGGAQKSNNRASTNQNYSGNRNISGSTNKGNNVSQHPNNPSRNNNGNNISQHPSNPSRNNNTNIRGNDVNINIDNSRNTVVRRNNIAAYPRPPYAWGGHRYYCFHPYAYHPFVPFYWGPTWHPWGFFVAALATTAIVVAIVDESNSHETVEYRYDEGVWYAPSNGGYTVVQAPLGGTVTTIPSGAQTVVVNNTTNYYYGGAYYEKSGSKYKVVPPPAGAVVDNLPAGGEEVKVGDQTYVKVGETYYQPVQVEGKNKYEVTQVEQGEK